MKCTFKLIIYNVVKFTLLPLSLIVVSIHPLNKQTDSKSICNLNFFYENSKQMLTKHRLQTRKGHF